MRSEEESNAEDSNLEGSSTSATVVHGASLNPNDLQVGPVVGEGHVNVVFEGYGEGNPTV